MEKSRLLILIIAQLVLLTVGLISFVCDVSPNILKGLTIVITLFSAGEIFRLYRK